MSNYALGEHGLLIPFGAMFENGDFSDYEGIPVFINIRTVVRNAISSYDLNTGNETNLLSTIKDELDNVCVLLERTFGITYNMPVTFYYCTHSDVKYGTLAYPVKETPKRKLVNKWTKVGVDHLKARVGVVTIEGSIRGPDVMPERVALITHYAQDLLFHAHFKELLVFESHTGEVKTKQQFNRKIELNKEQRSVIPFNRFTQHVFGDGTLFGPVPLDVRRTITDIAKKSGWTKSTPLNRVRFLLQQNNHALANLFNTLLN